jgi:5-methylthioadenosine/S-adenosylhomocysteine deaminase
LVALSGVQRMESYEVQIKVPLEKVDHIIARLEEGHFELIKRAHYRQYDHYLLFDGSDPDAARFRYREDSFLDDQGEIYQARTRLTLIGELRREPFPNAVMLSRSRYLSPAEYTLRFYQEYFDAEREMVVQKDRLRWRIIYQDTEMAINVDRVLQPAMPGYFVEVKARTWSRSDAKRKAELIEELLEELGVGVADAVTREYVELAAAQKAQTD